jgi:Holliday junction resolvase RusA-like endonuclease
MKHAREFLLGYNRELAEFVSRYKNQPITMRLVFHMPEKQLMTKNGLISKTSLDVDNLVKPTTDMLFRRMEQMNTYINDARIVRMVTEKKTSKVDEYGITALISYRE